MFVVWKVVKGSNEWFPYLLCENPSWIIQSNEIHKYQYLLREVDVEDSNQVQMDNVLKMYTVYRG